MVRYDKRTYVYGEEIASSASYSSFTVEEETIQDAIAAGELLAGDPRIDPDRIYLLGHSLGAMLAPRIVQESGELFAGMILACGSNDSLMDIMIRQNQDVIDALADEETRAAAQAQLDARVCQGRKAWRLYPRRKRSRARCSGNRRTTSGKWPSIPPPRSCSRSWKNRCC